MTATQQVVIEEHVVPKNYVVWLTRANENCNGADTIDLYRHKAPFVPIVFDHSPDSALWAIQQKWPLSSNCSNSPGKDLVSFVRSPGVQSGVEVLAG